MNLIICDEGFENTVKKHLERYNTEITSTKPTVIELNSSLEELAKISYSCQSIIKTIFDAKNFKVTADFDETTGNLMKVLPEIEESLILIKEGPIKVSCVRKGEHNYRSVDLASEFSKNLARETTYKNHIIEILIYIKDNKGYVGIDLASRNLAKRDYKIFSGAASLRGTIAFNLALEAEIQEGEVIIDPFMGSGTIPIELALYFSKKSPFYFTKEKLAFTKAIEQDWEAFFEKIDSEEKKELFPIYGYDSMLKFLKNTQKNAKIAEVHKYLNLSKVSIDWLDTKFEENSVDKIITHPPFLTEHGSKTKILRVYKDFFNQSKYLLKDEGMIVIITNENSAEYLKSAAKDNSIKCFEERDVFEGKQELKLLKFKK